LKCKTALGKLAGRIGTLRRPDFGDRCTRGVNAQLAVTLLPTFAEINFTWWILLQLCGRTTMILLRSGKV